jgi:hypothetical protein
MLCGLADRCWLHWYGYYSNSLLVPYAECNLFSPNFIPHVIQRHSTMRLDRAFVEDTRFSVARIKNRMVLDIVLFRTNGDKMCVFLLPVTLPQEDSERFDRLRPRSERSWRALFKRVQLA